MKTTGERLAKDLRERMKLVAQKAFYNEADITRLVNTSLDGFIDRNEGVFVP